MLWSKIWEAEVEAALDGQTFNHSPLYALPRAEHGPFLAEEVSLALTELTERLALQLPPKKPRIELALEFFARGLHDSQSFFLYWTGLELLANGKDQRIRERLCACYAFQRKSHLDERLAFAKVARWRHDLVHGGKVPKVSPQVERLLKLLFIDLLRHEIDLAPHHGALTFARTPGVDLSQLGLSPPPQQAPRGLATDQAGQPVQMVSRYTHQ
jgi:hypothetical protein